MESIHRPTPLNDMKLNGAVVVTGASSGIGEAAAKSLAVAGAQVCVNFHKNAQAAERVVADIERAGGRAIACRADVANVDDVQAMFARVDKELDALVGLVNNAAILDVQCSYEDIDVARFERLLRTNVLGAFLCAQQALNRMRRSCGGRGGAIVNVSSVAARTGSPNEYVDYAATKGALDSMTIGLAREVANDGVRVNGVRPGFIATGMHAKGGDPDRVARLSPKIPMRRGGEVDEVAAAIVWLLSDAASYTTGSFLDLAGGV